MNCRRSRRRGWKDVLATLAALRPWRCRACELRFFAWSVPASFVFYAHCTRCGNLDLQQIGREHVDESWLRGFWRLLGTPAYRCAPCRCRFFSARPLFPAGLMPHPAASETTNSDGDTSPP